MENMMNTCETYLNPDLPITERVEDLLGKLTLEEKLDQLSFKHNENHRLGIPLLGPGECLHGAKADGPISGLDGDGPTVFPQAVALGSTWDPELVERVADRIALECRALGMHICYSPNLDVAREPRNGRTEESYGEDPLLVSRMGVAFIEGLQGKGEQRYDDHHVMACPKHFAGYSEPSRGINAGWFDVSERTLREFFLPPFQAAIQEAQVGSLMPAHTDINGTPCHASQWLLQDVLRDEFGFTGLVVSDNRDIDRLHSMHRIAEDYGAAARIALRSGVDQEMVIQDEDIRCYHEPLRASVEEGLISEEEIDQAVRRVLTAKMELGLLDRKAYPVDEIFTDPERRVLALESARKAVTLLKNEERLLPLEQTKLRKVAVIGKLAKATPLGGYTTKVKPHIVSLLEGVQAKVGDETEVLYADGADVSGEDASKIPEAVALAEQCDVAIVCVGEGRPTIGEGKDRDRLDLPGKQQELVEAIVATGTPVVVVLLGGRPLALPWIEAHLSTLLLGWYLGCETGTALADVIFGEVNPGGKLTMTFPRSVGQLPVYYQQKISFTGTGKGEYVFAEKTPLFPFGFGLSYTEFTYRNLKVAKKVIRPDETTEVSVEVTNSGSRAGDEVVQFYVRDDFASFAPFQKILKNFQRITLQPGETRTLRFPVGFAELSMLDADLNEVIEPGAFTLMVGGSSVDLLEIPLTVTV